RWSGSVDGETTEFAGRADPHALNGRLDCRGLIPEHNRPKYQFSSTSTDKTMAIAKELKVARVSEKTVRQKNSPLALHHETAVTIYISSFGNRYRCHSGGKIRGP